MRKEHSQANQENEFEDINYTLQLEIKEAVSRNR